MRTTKGWGATLLVVLAFALSAGSADAAFSRRKPITINFGQVSGPANLPNFPVLISVVDTELRLTPSGDVTSTYGYDIVFRAEDDTTCGGVGTAPCVLDHEIERYDGSNGTLVAFVRVPVLQNSVNTTIFMYYGDATVTVSQENSGGVWDSNYREVFHLHETGDHTDSTLNGFTAVTKGTVNQGATGKIGFADDFIGPTESRLIISDGDLAPNTSFTLEAWVYIRSLQPPGTWTGLVIKGRDSNADWVGIGKSGSDNFALFWQCCNPPTQPGNLNGPGLSAGQWYYMSATYDSGTTTRRIYLDGNPVGNDTLGAQYPLLPEYTRVGDDSNGNFHDGLIDEVRVSDVARSADWIQTTYNSQFAPLTFYGVGAEDSSPPTVTAINSPVTEAPCQGIGSGTCHFRSIGTRPNYGTAEAQGGGTLVSAIASSPIVTGAGTTWLSSNRGRGDRITIDGTDYTILSVDGEAQLTLTSGFAGVSGGGKSYTIARKFSAPRFWESCIDGPGGAGCEGVSSSDLVSDNRGEVGIVYDDGSAYTYASVGSAILTINGSITDATHTITMTVDGANRHSGTTGTGVVLDNNINTTSAVTIQDDFATVEWLRVTGGATAAAGAFNLVAGAPDNFITVRNNLIHDVSGRGIRTNSVDARVDVINNILYETGSQPLRINSTLASGSRVRVLNNTFYNPTGSGISSISSSNPYLLLRNNILYDNSAGFNVNWINVGSSHNLSDDVAPPMFPVPPFTSDTGHSPRGAGVYGASVASASFADTTPGTEDLHIQSGSTAENTGVDLSAIYTIDIDGLLRIVPWDIGADEFSASVHFRSIGDRADYGTAEAEGPGTTVTATNGSTIVTGAGTLWLSSNRGRGDRITIAGVDYTVLSVDSENQLTLTEVYAGTSGSGKAYTIARKFDTLALWEDCIDGPGGAGCEGVSSNSLVTDHRNEIGIAYADSAFVGGLVIAGAATDASHTITLTVDPGNRHAGAEFSSGAILDNASLAADAISIQTDYVTLEWLEIANGGAGGDGVDVRNLNVTNYVVLRNLLVHDTSSSGIQLEEPDLKALIYNNIIHSNSTRGIMMQSNPSASSSIEIYNNTFHANAFYAIDSTGSGSQVVVLRNNVAVNNTPGNFSVTAGLITPASSHNLSSDGSATSHSPGGNAITGAALASLNFISTSVTYVNLHIQNGSAAQGNGVDLSSIFTNDIDNEARPAVWDRGADQAFPSDVWYRSIGTRNHFGNAGPEGAGTTVNATTGSAVVTGVGGTTWLTSNRGRGDRITINSNDYTVLRVNSDTELVLTEPFVQSSGSGLNYSIERKFTTLAAWEQCVDNTTPCPGVATSSLVADNRREVGIAYADSAYGASVAIEGATADATRFITLTADHGNRHYGLETAGVYIVGTEVTVEVDYTVVEWLEVTGSGTGFRVRDASNVLLQFLIARGNAGNGVQMAGAGNNDFTIRNSIVYNNTNDGIAGDEATDHVTVQNCTVFGNTDQGIEDNNSPFTIVNTISMNNGANDYSVASVIGSNNISSDGSTAGAGTLTNRVATENQTPGAGNWVIFQNISGPAENFHLGGNAENDALDTATDLSSSFPADIDGGLRTALWDVGADDFVATTEVELVSFEALPGDGAVELRWETGSELDNLGFNLYRAAAADGPYQRITSRLIPGLGSSPEGAVYSYRDTELDNGTTYFYQLEDIDTSAEATLHGPVFATPSEEAGPESDDDASDDDASPKDSARIRYGNPEANSIEITKRGKYGVRIELKTEGFYAVPLPDGTVRLEIPGFETDADGVPVRLAWIDALAGRHVDLHSVRGRRVDTITTWTPAGELREAHAARDGTVRAGARRTRRARIQGENLARVASVGFQGDDKRALVELSPMHWDGERLALARHVVARLSLRRRDPSDSAADTRRVAAKNAKSVFARLVTRDEGLYAVRFADVMRGRRALPTDRLVLRHGGEAVPFRVEPNTQRFGPGSRLLFVSDGAGANPYANELVFELAVGTDSLPMVERSAAPSAPGPSVYLQRIEREESSIYQAGLVHAPDVWLWALVMGRESKTFPFQVQNLATGDATVRVWLQGASDLDATPDHHVVVFVNGAFVTETSFDGKATPMLEALVPAGILVEGENTVTIENVGDTTATYSMVMLDRFAVDYPRRAISSDAHVIDITGAPEWLVDIERASSGVRFAVDPDRRYLVVPTDEVLTPEVRAPGKVNLRRRRRADYIAIGPRPLLDAMTPLLAHRRDQGLRVQTVSVEAIYDEFGFGEPRPQAIRDFLTYAYHEWKRPAPRYVVLIGDATYDFKDHLQTGVSNDVPPYMVKTSYLWTASDPAFAAVNGDDLLPDLAIGRLPVSTPDEAARLAEKIVAFELGEHVLGDAPVVLVTDDPDAAGDFDRNARELANGVLSRFDPVHLSLSDYGPGAMKDSIVGAFDDGASMVSYIGHGGIHLWASENIFNRNDVASLSSQPRQPLLLTMNCLNGYFHFPYFDSLAEALVTADARGAIAAFSPSGLSLDDPAHRYHKILLESLANGGHARLGDAVLSAQKAYLDTGAFPELLSIYHLFGDPALTLR